MQSEAAAELRRAWGGKPCDHPNITREYYLGSATGDYVCTTCGETRWGDDWNAKPKPDK
jgi:hypothetical protein